MMGKKDKPKKEYSFNTSNASSQQQFLVTTMSNFDAKAVQGDPLKAFEDFGRKEDSSSPAETVEVVDVVLEENPNEESISSSKTANEDVEELIVGKREEVNEEESSISDEKVSSSKETGEVVAEPIVSTAKEERGVAFEKKDDGTSTLDENFSTSKETNEVVEGTIDATTQEVKKENTSEVKESVDAQDWKEKKSTLAKESDRNVSDNAFSLCKIMRKSQTENSEMTALRLKKETVLMLDAILSVSDKKVSKATIIHNLVSAFLEENKKILKEKSAKRKDYF